MRLAQLGADVTIACRNPDKAFAALEDIKAQAPGAQVMYSTSSLPVVRVQGELQDHASCIIRDFSPGCRLFPQPACGFGGMDGCTYDIMTESLSGVGTSILPTPPVLLHWRSLSTLVRTFAVAR